MDTVFKKDISLEDKIEEIKNVLFRKRRKARVPRDFKSDRSLLKYCNT